MRRYWYRNLAICFLSQNLFAADQLSVASQQVDDPYRSSIRDRFIQAEKSMSVVVQGAGDWLFFTPELRALTATSFWADDASRVSRATNLQFADPLGPIVDFHEQLKREGIELLLVPVPAKASIYPEKLLPDVKTEKHPSRIEIQHVRFYKLLQERGVHVLDLHVEFEKQKAVRDLFCHTDSHWSGFGTQVAAEAIAAQVKTQPWFKKLAPAQKLNAELIQESVIQTEITGDLAVLLNENMPAKERLELSQVTLRVGEKQQPLPTNDDSPILLLGDSHTLVFHDPTLHAEGCGLPDHLAKSLALKLDLIGVRGSGANAARVNWRRRPKPLANKKLVIWCFSFREFTENSDGWKKIPIQRPQ